MLAGRQRVGALPFRPLDVEQVHGEGRLAVLEIEPVARSLRCHAELVVVEADHLIGRPTHVSWEQAGALFVAGTTAYAAVHAVSLKAGDTVAISGAAGGVGRPAWMTNPRNAAPCARGQSGDKYEYRSNSTDPPKGIARRYWPLSAVPMLKPFGGALSKKTFPMNEAAD